MFARVWTLLCFLRGVIEDAGGASPAAPWEFVEVSRSIESRDAARMPAIKWLSAHPTTVLGLWVRVLMDASWGLFGGPSGASGEQP